MFDAQQRAPKVAGYEAVPGQVKKVVLLFSGGLDSSVMVHWIRENYGCDVVTFTANLGDPNLDPHAITAKAKALGAVDAVCPDLIETFAADFCAPAILANADYMGGGYHLSCPLGRVITAREAVKFAQSIGADAIAHGCTGKGNDQVRFDVYVQMLDPKLKIIAPVREWNMGREEEYAYAKKHNIPVPPPRSSGHGASYSNDDNIWGFTAEGGDIEFPDRTPPLDEILRFCAPPEKTPDQPEIITLDFIDGLPVKLNGQEKSLATIVRDLNGIAGAHGVGFVILIEDRIVGLKVRGVYEAPAAHTILAAHRELEKLVSKRALLDLKRPLETVWANKVYDAQYYDQEMPPLMAFFTEANKGVTGTATIKLFKGRALVTAVKSSRALFDANLGTFERIEGGGFNTAASAPFIELYSLAGRQAYTIAHHTAH